MTVSAKALFHFTSFDSLKNILKIGFHPNYCAEDYRKLLPTDTASHTDFLIPMLCLCDLPLGNIFEHIKEYGCYGIGLTKKWGIEKGLNPVQYTHRRADVHFLRTTLDSLMRGLLSNHISSLPDKLKENWEQIDLLIENYFCYIKPIEGRRWDNSVLDFKNKTISFYNEREWRCIPRLSKAEKSGYGIIELLGSTQELKNRINSQTQNLNRHLIKFEPNDIKHLIVKNNSEIYDFIKFIDEIFSKDYSKQEIALLKTKIISVETLKEDF